jgi:hypothetical protein
VVWFTITCASFAHVYSKVAPDNLTGVIIADEDYPPRVAFSLLNKILDEYSTAIPVAQWSAAASTARRNTSTKADASVDFAPLTAYLAKYQDPKQADTIMRVQQELDETKIILHKTIEEVLERGEKVRPRLAALTSEAHARRSSTTSSRRATSSVIHPRPFTSKPRQVVCAMPSCRSWFCLWLAEAEFVLLPVLTAVGHPQHLLMTFSGIFTSIVAVGGLCYVRQSSSLTHIWV